MRSRYPLRELGSFAPTVQYGCSKRADVEPVATPIIRMSNLQADGWALDELKYVELTPTELARWRLNPGDILFNRTNSKELVGKCEVFRETGDWVFASYLVRVVIDEDIAIPEFVAAFLNGPTGRAQIERDSRQIIGMTNINAEEIKSLRVPLPEPDVQRALLDQLNLARTARDAGLAAADALLTSLDSYVLGELGLGNPVLHDAARPFAVRLSDLRAGGKLFADYYHPDRTGTLAALRAAGPAPELDVLVSFIREQRVIEDGDFYVGLANVAAGTGEFLQVAEEVAGTVSVFQAGDVLFARLRPYLNKVWVADRNGVCSPEFYVLRLRNDQTFVTSPDYLATVLRSSPTLAQTRHMMTGNTHPRIANEDAVRLLVPAGGPVVQARIAAEVTRRRTQARQMRTKARSEWSAARRVFEVALLGPDPASGASA
jgi:type I restriction enzyme S subunit